MLEVYGLKAGYGAKAVVELPQLTLKRGEHCLIMGKSGSGKTTLLYALGGLLRPMAGEIRLRGTLVDTTDDDFRGRNIGIIYQTLHMVAALSVLDNLFLARYANGLSQDRSMALRLLERLGIADKKDNKPTALSQGQQQRLAVARAAMNEPALILGDEPTSALDDESCEATARLLLEVAHISGANLIIATHDVRLTKHFSTRLVLGETI